MKQFQPIMINLSYIISVPGSGGGSFREGTPAEMCLGSDGYIYYIVGDGTIDQLDAYFCLIRNMTEQEFNTLGVILSEYVPEDI